MRLDRFILGNGKQLRYGYTTGSCAAAASKAAAIMLLEQRPVHRVALDTPKGWTLVLEVEDGSFTQQMATCAVVKDGGDDPDVTHGLKIYSKVTWRGDQAIVIDGGPGVGRVTKKGLPMPVGMAAINPVPRKMIEAAVREVIGKDRGVNVEISVPQGETVALRTFNPRLGILGGISILGTSGIVEPMSEEALKESLAIELRQLALEDGLNRLVLVPGNYGRDLARDTLGIKEQYIFRFSNFMGYILDEALDKGFQELLIIGHVGKLVKVAGGIFHTHSKIADGRLEIITAHLALMGVSPEDLRLVMECNTTEAAVNLIQAKGYGSVFNRLAEKVTEKCIQRTYGKIKIASILFSMEHGILGKCAQADTMVEGFKNE